MILTADLKRRGATSLQAMKGVFRLSKLMTGEESGAEYLKP
jgi:hypothetical protein